MFEDGMFEGGMFEGGMFEAVPGGGIALSCGTGGRTIPLANC